MHPNAVVKIRLEDFTVDDEIVNTGILYIAVYLGIVFLGSVLLTLMQLDATSAMSGIIACMGNVGPGLGSVGSMANYAHLTDAAKLVLTVVMLLGRLEIYALFILFKPAQWQQSITY